MLPVAEQGLRANPLQGNGKRTMDRNEQQLIDDLFANLAEVERNSGPRDTEAERYIGQLMSRQPSAPYFMTQSLVLQEQALRAAQERIAELERALGQGQGGGSFLGGTRVGAGGSVPAAGGQFRYPAPPPSYEQAPSRYEQQPQQRYPEPEPERRGGGVGGFLTGVAQTAAGVAGGMMLGNMLGGLFGGGHSSQSGTQSAGHNDTSTLGHEAQASHQLDYQDTNLHEADFSDQDFGGFDDLDI